MMARIYKPAKTAMQSGIAKTKEWVLDYEPEQPREIEPLMGWTSSGDMRQQVQLRFDTLEQAVAYCERHGIGYQVFKSKPPVRRGMSYADNFSVNRRDGLSLYEDGVPMFEMGERRSDDVSRQPPRGAFPYPRARP